MLVILLVEFLSIAVLSHLRSGYSYGAILINLIVVSIFGGQLVNVSGWTTSIGSIFFVAITLTYFLMIERHGSEWSQKTTWSSVFLVLLLFILCELTIQLIPGDTSAIKNAIASVLAISSRITVATVFSFFVAQNFNLFIVEKLKAKWKKNKLALQINLTNAATQVIACAIFFPLAFLGQAAPATVLHYAIVGLVLRIIIGIVATPLVILGLPRNNPS